MYQCAECGKGYARQNSLTRHLQNHRKTKRYVCPSCKVNFNRSDLLSRHVKLHQETNTSTQTDRPQVKGVRRRCHTACSRCRELKIKCNGRYPCSTCVEANRESQCHFKGRSNRLSHVPTSGEDSESFSLTVEPHGSNDHRSTSNQSEGDEASDSLNPSHHYPLLSIREAVPENDLGTEDQCFVPSDQNGDISSHLALLTDISQDSLNHGADFMQDPIPDEVGLQTNSLTFDVVSWPWLHESIYLPSSQDKILDSGDLSNMMDFTSNIISEPPISHTTQSLDSQYDDTLRGISTQLPSLVPVTQASRLNTHAAPKAPTNQCTEVDEAYIWRLKVISELVTHAISPTSLSEQNPDRSTFWKSMSPKVAEAFHLNSDVGDSSNSTLQHFVDLYMQYFGPLWPLLSYQNLKVDHLHPVLYLTLTSIGAMYGDTAASSYGTMMHNSIRSQLTSAFELDDLESDLMWLAQARLLTQVAALYFGQPKAFSYAQHLGALLVAQARRMDLFSAPHAQSKMATFPNLSGSSTPDSNRLAAWLHLEARRRLAFGIFRGDTYTSVLLHVKPLVCMEEIDLELPSCDAVWRGAKMPPQVCLYLIEHDRTPSRDMRASDIYRIAMDTEEPLPPLDPAGHELLLFGLQWSIWRFSRDRKVFERLNKRANQSLVQQEDVAENSGSVARSMVTGMSSWGTRPSKNVSADKVSFEADHLECFSSRQMNELTSECSRFMSALRKWEEALSLVKKAVHTDGDRSSLLSSLILYHLGYVRLYAPMEDLHQIQYRLADSRTPDDALICSAQQWADSPQARLAAERACKIWSLITTECRKSQTHRVRFNLLAFTGLHHVAVLLWSYAGARDQAKDLGSGASPLSLATLDDPCSVTLVTRAESSGFLNSFVRLYDLISPARWSSFAKAAGNLSNQVFPTLSHQRVSGNEKRD